MKINPKNIHQIYQTQTKSSSNTKEVISNRNVDKVEVSALAKQNVTLQKVKNELTTSINTEFSKDKISELKTMIQSGKYEVKHRQVADAIIAFSEIVLGDKND